MKFMKPKIGKGSSSTKFIGEVEHFLDIPVFLQFRDSDFQKWGKVENAKLTETGVLKQLKFWILTRNKRRKKKINEKWPVPLLFCKNIAAKFFFLDYQSVLFWYAFTTLFMLHPFLFPKVFVK